MEWIVMTPEIIGQLLDSLVDGDKSRIVAAGLSLMLKDDIDCRVSHDRCEVFVFGNLIAEADMIAKLVLSIPTVSDDGKYDGSSFCFRRCDVFAVVASAVR